MVPSLVTDAHSRAAVAGIRALGRAGVPVLALSHRRLAPGSWSRHACGRLLGPPPSDPERFVARIAEIALGHGPLAVFPGQEESVDAFMSAADMLGPNALRPYPDGDCVQALRDKSRLAELSARVGLPSPAILASGPVAQILASLPSGPCVLKPRDYSAALEAVVVCNSGASLERALAGLPAGEPVIVQEWISGALSAVSLVLDRDGRVAARFQQRTVRLWPESAGVSSLAISVEPEEELIERVADMLRATGFWGLAQVQLLVSEDRRAVIDVNPRYYGSLPLALAAGVNLPLAWYQVTLGRVVPAASRYRAGATYRWLEADLTAAYRGDWGRLLTRAPRPSVGAMWAWDDPVAGALLAADAAAARMRRRLPRAIG